MKKRSWYFIDLLYGEILGIDFFFKGIMFIHFLSENPVLYREAEIFTFLACCFLVFQESSLPGMCHWSGAFSISYL